MSTFGGASCLGWKGLARRLARHVPRRASAVAREGHAVHLAVRQAYLARLHLQAHPLSSRRQRPHITPALRSFLAHIDDLVGPPVGAVLPPSAVVPLQHHLFWHVGRVQVDVGEQPIPTVYAKRSSSI